MAGEFYQVSLKAIIRRADGKILCLNGKIATSFESYYDLPGGRIDRDEFKNPFVEILQRELKEEIGNVPVSISSTPCALGRHWSLDGYPVLYVFFPAECLEPFDDVSVSHEHEGFSWLSITEENVKDYFVSGILEGVKQYIQT